MSIDKFELVKKEIERLKAEELMKKDHCKRTGLTKIMARVGLLNNLLAFIDGL